MQTKEMTLASLIIAIMMTITIISVGEIIIVQAIALLSFFILSKSVSWKMYWIAVQATIIMFLIFNILLVFWLIPAFIIPKLWFKNKSILINTFSTSIAGILTFTSTYILLANFTAVVIDESIEILSFLIVGETIFAVATCYLGDLVYERINK